ncbi:MAG: TldD/PmbA family protein [candidate division WOR-3 bacterium]|nr:TldD/PmbA family protein [candidate division WOR-3 bacterium]
MIDKNKTKELLSAALTPLDMSEVGIFSIQRGTTRFANSTIHQNITVENPYLWTRVIIDSSEGKRIGGLSTRNLTPTGVKMAICKAAELAMHSTPDKDFVSLPKPTTKSKIKEHKTEVIEVVTPEQRASAVREIVKICKRYNLDVAGVIHTSTYSLGIRNNFGIDKYAQGMDTYVSVTAMSENSSGFTAAANKKFDNINWKELAEIASEKALLSKNPKEISPGTYTVLLEPFAVAEIIMFLGWLEFGAKAFAEKRSIISKNLGKQITGENITIVDDSAHPLSLALPFDFEGVDRKKVLLIDKGIAKGVVFDSFYANKLKKTNTGHALPQPNPYGPFPANLVVKPGTKSMSDMLKMLDKGILVTRFWYTRVVDPDKTLITGLTRDGTFWVENGKIQYGIKNLRYTINIYETLKQVIAISKENFLTGENASVVAPALLIKDFNFTGKTQY